MGKSSALTGFLTRAGAGVEDVAAALKGSPTKMVEVELIKVKENLNPRGYLTGESAFEGPGFDALKASIQEHGGLLQPVIVRPHPDPDFSSYYQLVAGERRWRAAKDLGFVSILAIVSPLTYEQVEVVVRDENDLREHVAKIDHKVSLLHALARQAGIEPHTLSTVLTRLRNHPAQVWDEGTVEARLQAACLSLKAPPLDTLITQWVRFLSFTETEIAALAAKQVSENVLNALSRLPANTDPEVRKQLLAQAIEGGWGRKEMTAAVREVKEQGKKPKQSKAVTLAQARQQVKTLLSKDSLGALGPDAEVELLRQIEALVLKAKAG